MKTSLLPLSPSFAWKEGSLLLVGAILLPFLVHLIPWSGPVPIGAMFLPLFIFPLIATRLYGWQVGGLIGILAPLANYLMTGQPSGELLLLFTLEIAAFVLLIHLLRTNKWLIWVIGPLAFLLAKAVSASLISWFSIPLAPLDFWLRSLINGWPGLLALLLVSSLIRYYEPNTPSK